MNSKELMKMIEKMHGAKARSSVEAMNEIRQNLKAIKGERHADFVTMFASAQMAILGLSSGLSLNGVDDEVIENVVTRVLTLTMGQITATAFKHSGATQADMDEMLKDADIIMDKFLE